MIVVDELNQILKPSWGAEEWILEGWNSITRDEKNLIRARIDCLFKDGLPFELKHNKLLYIYTFSLLAQLEVLAIQVPLKFESKMTKPEFRAQLRTQLLDEIFHGLVFTKIVYLLCAPHSLPPAYNKQIEELCNFIRGEDCPKVAVVLLNLIAEGWIEETFRSLMENGIAPEVFSTIMEDEHRHVCEADLYREIGLPNMVTLRSKVDYMEKQLLSNLLVQYKYNYAVSSLLGMDATNSFLRALDSKHKEQLHKIGLKPSKYWTHFMGMSLEFFSKLQQHSHGNHEIEMTSIRKTFMTQWNDPSDPTMTGEFNLNVSCLDFFQKKFPSETITLLLMQVISSWLKNNNRLRLYLSHKKLYQSKDAYVGLVVKLPDCADHIGTIVFENCHLYGTRKLSLKIRNNVSMMVYCYKKREQLELDFPHLTSIIDDTLYAFANDFYGHPIPGNSVVSLSNIGSFGYTQTKSPLRCNESMKFTLLKVDRKPVWDHALDVFKPQDMLPISVSADHRIFDGNTTLPKEIQVYFDKAFQAMLEELSQPLSRGSASIDGKFAKLFDLLIEKNIEVAYRLLTLLQTYCLDFMEVEDLLRNYFAKSLLTPA